MEKLTREEKIARARELASRGLNNQQIAERLGVGSRKTVWGWLNPERLRRLKRAESRRRRDKNRVWRNQHRASCDGCGTALRAGSASPSAKGKTGLCKKCLGRAKAESGRRRREDARRLHEAGVGTAEISRQMQVAPSTVDRWLAGGPHPGRACSGCGGTFQPQHKNQRYCSADCRTRPRNHSGRKVVAA